MPNLDTYEILAAQWGVSRDEAKARVLGKTTGDPADDVSEDARAAFKAVVKGALQRRQAEDKINAEHS